jgi:hypothetical protein
MECIALPCSVKSECSDFWVNCDQPETARGHSARKQNSIDDFLATENAFVGESIFHFLCESDGCLSGDVQTRIENGGNGPVPLSMCDRNPLMNLNTMVRIESKNHSHLPFPLPGSNVCKRIKRRDSVDDFLADDNAMRRSVADFISLNFDDASDLPAHEHDPPVPLPAHIMTACPASAPSAFGKRRSEAADLHRVATPPATPPPSDVPSPAAAIPGPAQPGTTPSAGTDAGRKERRRVQNREAQRRFRERSKYRDFEDFSRRLQRQQQAAAAAAAAAAAVAAAAAAGTDFAIASKVGQRSPLMASLM